MAHAVQDAPGVAKERRSFSKAEVESLFKAHDKVAQEAAMRSRDEFVKSRIIPLREMRKGLQSSPHRESLLAYQRELLHIRNLRQMQPTLQLSWGAGPDFRYARPPYDFAVPVVAARETQPPVLKASFVRPNPQTGVISIGLGLGRDVCGGSFIYPKCGEWDVDYGQCSWVQGCIFETFQRSEVASQVAEVFDAEALIQIEPSFGCANILLPAEVPAGDRGCEVWVTAATVIALYSGNRFAWSEERFLEIGRVPDLVTVADGPPKPVRASVFVPKGEENVYVFVGLKMEAYMAGTAEGNTEGFAGIWMLGSDQDSITNAIVTFGPWSGVARVPEIKFRFRDTPTRTKHGQQGLETHPAWEGTFRNPLR